MERQTSQVGRKYLRTVISACEEWRVLEIKGFSGRQIRSAWFLDWAAEFEGIKQSII